MVFMLVIADALVPSVAQELPPRLKELLKPGRLSTVLCLGNCSREIINVLKRVTSDVKRVRGDHDNDDSLPDTRIIELEGFKLGMCHGHQVVPRGDEQALLALQRKLGVDVLLTSATHQLSVRQLGSALFLDPGSATGASTVAHANPPPSFIVMDVSVSKVQLWTYCMLGDKLDVERHTFVKPGEASAAAGTATDSLEGGSTASTDTAAGPGPASTSAASAVAAANDDAPPSDAIDAASDFARESTAADAWTAGSRLAEPAGLPAAGGDEAGKGLEADVGGSIPESGLDEVATVGNDAEELRLYPGHTGDASINPEADGVGGSGGPAPSDLQE